MEWQIDAGRLEIFSTTVEAHMDYIFSSQSLPPFPQWVFSLLLNLCPLLWDCAKNVVEALLVR